MTSPKARLGRALKSIRSQLKLTLADMSARTGVSVSTLSKIENGQLSPTYVKLVQLSERLELDINAFFSEAPVVPPVNRSVSARRSITPRKQGLLVKTRNYDYRYLCTDLAHKAMVPILITIRARSIAEFSSLSKHSGEEFLHVLRGEIEVHTEVYEPVLLQAGDSMYMDSTMGHAFLATSAQSALILNVCYSSHSAHFRTLVEMAMAMQEGGAGALEPIAEPHR